MATYNLVFFAEGYWLKLSNFITNKEWRKFFRRKFLKCLALELIKEQLNQRKSISSLPRGLSKLIEIINVYSKYLFQFIFRRHFKSSGGSGTAFRKIKLLTVKDRKTSTLCHKCAKPICKGQTIVDKTWAPHKVCKTCVETLRLWTKGERQLTFGIPMVWQEPKNHNNDCYFCVQDLKHFNKNGKKKFIYKDLYSARLPIPHSPNSPLPVFSSSANNPLYDESEDTTQKDIDLDDSDSENYGEKECPKRFSQPKLNDLTRDLRLSRQDEKLLSSRLK
ncbi:hypothetical protein LAZ67_18001192 [Cordylochernes scorpioides]|uniref:Uncharacterized protein n=1 Tax=Cordylochernes scorpioides TaxID=51811 RepID=A0ABY6LFY1_9ARAC|nr:hypothetical protein LAZ67_18001192 [Cordylochernes scorpioides]